MGREIALTQKRGQGHVFPKPKTEDPFINCRLVSLGDDGDGVERFIISSLNGTTGARTLVLNERGEYRVYGGPGREDPSYCYGAVSGGPNTVWMGGWSPSAGLCLWRLTLSTGAAKAFPVPAGHFITAGMAYDPDTKKLFTGCGSAMVSFDTARGKILRIYSQEEMGPCHFHYFHWRNRDGSYGFLLLTPGITYVRWFPREERITAQVLTEDPRHPALKSLVTGPCIQHGKVYLPHMGLLNGLTGRLTPHPHPPREEAGWFGAIGNIVYGAQRDALSGDSTVVRWNTRTGDTRPLISLPDQPAQGLALTRSGRLLAVDLHGLIRRIHAESGALELTRKYEHRSVHIGNAICPAGRDTVVGAPFICQNFWILNTTTGTGQDGGRAAGLYGQIDAALNVRGKVYFCAYGGGQLTEYDPERPANWPRNPRLVARNDQGQHGAGMASDGRVVWVSFRPLYGTLDGAMIRYDTQTGEASYRNGALKDHHLLDPIWDAATRQIIAGTSFLSDCNTAVPVCSDVYAVALDPVSMDVIKKAAAPEGLDHLSAVGPLGDRRWLMRSMGLRALPRAQWGDAGDCVGVFDEAACRFSTRAEMILLPTEASDLLYAGRPGLFLLSTPRALRLWDFNCNRFSDLARLRRGFVRRCWVHGKSVYCDCVRKVAVLRNVLP